MLKAKLIQMDENNREANKDIRTDKKWNIIPGIPEEDDEKNSKRQSQHCWIQLT